MQRPAGSEKRARGAQPEAPDARAEAKAPARVCAKCGVGVAAQSSFRRTFHYETKSGRHFVVVGHLCHGCRLPFRTEADAARFLENELEPLFNA